jgi:hypothetical protein
MRDIVRSALVASAVLGLVACGPICGFGASLALSNAHVDATYSCPYPANDLPYDVHATIDAKNSSFGSVQVKSIQENWTNFAIHGNWSGTKGAHGTDSINKFSPKSIGAGGSTTIKFVIPFTCTNSGASGDTWGDFSFKFVVKTSAGDYTINPNNHRLTFSG